MLTFSNSVVSMDGYKSVLIEKAYKKYKKNNMNNFVIMGHPKSLTLFSLQKIEEFIKKHKDEKFSTFKNEF